MNPWSITRARAKFSDLFDAALTAGPRRIERRGREAVVMIAESDWKRLVGEYRTVADLVLNCPLDPRDTSERRPARDREGAGVNVCS